VWLGFEVVLDIANVVGHVALKLLRLFEPTWIRGACWGVSGSLGWILRCWDGRNMEDNSPCASRAI
jgi:hypothetical protein